MGKRMTATEKWDKAWFRKLSPRHKSLWQFLVDKCDHAGMWEIDFDNASHYVNDASPITAEDLKAFGARVEMYSGDKLWIVSFCDFQYENLSEKCPAHKPVFKLLRKYSLLNRVLNRVSNTLQEKEKEIVKEKEPEEEKEKEEFKYEFVEKKSEAPVTPEVTQFPVEQVVEEILSSGLNEIYIDKQRPKWTHIDFEAELTSFREKVRGSPEFYQHHDTSGIQLAFQSQLRKAPKRNHVKGNNKNDRTEFNQNELAIINQHISGAG